MYLFVSNSKVASRIRNATMMEAYTFFGGEMFQVANYGIGGQYTKHWDAAGYGNTGCGVFKEGIQN
jgi:hypothetical protein